MEPVFVVVAESCSDCCSITASVFSEIPSESEIEKVKQSIGGMYCIKATVFESAIDELKDRTDAEPTNNTCELPGDGR